MSHWMAIVFVVTLGAVSALLAVFVIWITYRIASGRGPFE